MNPQLKKYYIFLGASLVFSIGLQIVLGYLGVPWFISIGLVMAIFIILPMYMRRKQMGQMGNFGGSSSGGGGGFFGGGGQVKAIVPVLSMCVLFAGINTMVVLVLDVDQKCKEQISR